MKQKEVSVKMTKENLKLDLTAKCMSAKSSWEDVTHISGTSTGDNLS